MNKLATFVAMMLGSSGVAAIGLPSDANAATGNQLRAEQEACENALRQNTIEALEEFLRKYPRGDSACRALALNSLNGFGPSNKGDNSNRGEVGPQGAPGYGGG